MEILSHLVENSIFDVKMTPKLVIGTINLEKGRHVRMQDLAILTETKIVNEIYAREAEGYSITATVAKSFHQGGVALVHRKESDRFTVEGTLAFGPNVIRTTVNWAGKHGPLLVRTFHRAKPTASLLRR